MSHKPSAFSITGEAILPLGLGTHGHGHAFGGISKDESLAILESIRQRLPTDSKILIDTAPRYGHGTAETWIGEFLASRPNGFLIATKGGRHIKADRDNEKDFSADFLRYDLENSLSRLRTDRVFLYQLHNPSVDVIRHGGVFETLEDFRSQGLIQWYGVSINTPEEGIAAIDVCRRNGYDGFVALQVIFSALTKVNVGELFRVASDARIAIVTREVMVRGFLTDKYNASSEFDTAPSAVRKLVKLYGKEQLTERGSEIRRMVAPYNISLAQAALRFSIQNPSVTVTLAGINRTAYFDEDWGAVNFDLPLDLLASLGAVKDLQAPTEA